MRARLVLSALVATLALSNAGAQDRVQDNPTAACDAAAAAPASDGLPAGVAGVPPWKIDPRIAVPACEAAAKLEPDNARISFQLGRAYAAERSFSSALSAFMRADERGYALATFNLSIMFKYGDGVAVDLEKARSLAEKAVRGGAAVSIMGWLEKAAADGEAQAMDRLAVYYRDGLIVPADEARAAEWMKRAVEARREAAGASIRLRAAVDQARPKIVESNVPQSEIAAASLSIELAAEAGDVYAMALIGWMYAQGRGVERDYVRARKWSEKAAGQGHAMSMVAVGRIYHYGCGVAPDATEARRWYDMARTSTSALAAKFAAQSRALLDRPDIYRTLISQPQAGRCLPPMAAP